MSSYRDLFTEHLESELRAGGSPDYMVVIAEVYSNRKEEAREYAFQEWLHDRQFSCSKCQKSFSPGRERNIGEYDQVRCAGCIKEC